MTQQGLSPGQAIDFQVYCQAECLTGRDSHGSRHGLRDNSESRAVPPSDWESNSDSLQQHTSQAASEARGNPSLHRRSGGTRRRRGPPAWPSNGSADSEMSQTLLTTNGQRRTRPGDFKFGGPLSGRVMISVIIAAHDPGQPTFSF
jgi:hypothetical protein